MTAYRNKLTVIIFVILFSFSSYARHGSQRALLIIDMQYYFLEKGHTQSTLHNATRLTNLLIEQRNAILAAKEFQIPIFVIEYANSKINGEKKNTHSNIIKAIGDYKYTQTIPKTVDGVFSNLNRYRDVLEMFLRGENVGELIIMGINGGSCVLKSIRGALNMGYDVIAYSKGISDLNKFINIYPYENRYVLKLNGYKEKCPDCIFREVKKKSEIKLIMERGVLQLE